MINGQRVLVVDGLSDTQEVLQTILEPRGLSVERLDNPLSTGPRIAGLRPDLVVIDVDSAISEQSSNQQWQGVPQVLIGSARGPQRDRLSTANGGCYLQKPFQYPELIQAVEQILAASSKRTASPS